MMIANLLDSNLLNLNLLNLKLARITLPGQEFSRCACKILIAQHFLACYLVAQ
jgi:hypothetical protein